MGRVTDKNSDDDDINEKFKSAYHARDFPAV